jgi:hypothetical protein
MIELGLPKACELWEKRAVVMVALATQRSCLRPARQ